MKINILYVVGNSSHVETNSATLRLNFDHTVF